MHSSRRIIICGTSLFMQSIQAAFSDIPDLSIIVFDNDQSDLVERLKVALPDLVILEQDFVETATSWAILRHGFRVIELTPQTTVGRVFHSEQRPITTTGDLISIITD
ncbi:MAG: hypothetical protein WAM60_13555 [Candidatus Promineifilaceae bacterium]